MLLSREEKPNSVDSVIAAEYTGVDRDQLRYIRKQCLYCNANAESILKISVDCPPVVRNLIMAPNALDARRITSVDNGRGHRCQSRTKS